MKYAWIVRPYPHDYYRIKEFLNENIVAIGWPNIGDLANCKTREQIKEALRKHYSYSSPQSLGQAAGNIYRFIYEMKTKSYVIVPDGQLIYFGIINDEYIYIKEKDNDEQGYCHQRPVKWLYDKKAISRNLLTGRVYDSLKGQQTVFTTYHEDIEDIIKNKKHFFTQQPNFDLKTEYLNKLQSGLLKHVNSNTFENAVCSLFNNYFLGLRRFSNH